MFVVLFEVQPRSTEWDTYLDLAGQLRPKLERMPGFIDNERYRSERDDGRVLSLSTWQDEKALVRWRAEGEHHGVQEKGRFEVFEDYRLRVGEVAHDSDTDDLPQTRFDVTQQGGGQAATVTEVMPGGAAPDDPEPSDGLAGAEWYSGINTEGKRLLLATWSTVEAAAAWARAQSPGPRNRVVRVVRDYGMHDREEAPQYYPPVEQQRTAA
jgi:heme-degrading monooxygenase HmoA